ncbi:unnamed protein product, partial [Prorocentrum cordatum]
AGAETERDLNWDEEKEEEEEQGGGRKGATVGARPVSRAVLKHEALPAGWRGQEEAPRGRRPRAAPWRQPSTLSR